MTRVFLANDKLCNDNKMCNQTRQNGSTEHDLMEKLDGLLWLSGDGCEIFAGNSYI